MPSVEDRCPYLTNNKKRRYCNASITGMEPSLAVQLPICGVVFIVLYGKK